VLQVATFSTTTAAAASILAVCVGMQSLMVGYLFWSLFLLLLLPLLLL
jgi:hypothetical protein